MTILENDKLVKCQKGHLYQVLDALWGLGDYVRVLSPMGWFFKRETVPVREGCPWVTCNESEIKEQTMSRKKVESSHPVNKSFGGNLSIFRRDDGGRGLMAVKDFESGEIVFQEYPYLWFNYQEDNLGIGLSWGLTRNIAIKFPSEINYMRNEIMLQEAFKPKLTSSDKQILAQISRESRLSKREVRKIYNLVCTYNIISSLHALIGDTALIGERMSIALGLAFANHSCEPNCTRLVFDSIEGYRSRAEGLRATRTIRAGEEVTWSYLITTSDSLEDRQRTLREKFGFRCNCDRCYRELQDSDGESA